MLFANKKKKDLLTVIAELSGVEKKSSTVRTIPKDGEPKTNANQLVIRDIKVSVEIPQLEELLKEVRELKEIIREFVQLIKSRIEQSEAEQTEESQTYTEQQTQ